MDISKRTRFGLNAILALSGGGHHSLASLIAAIRAPHNLLAEILGELQHAGVVTCRRGQKGGYSLERVVLELTVADIIEILEDGGRLAPCSGRQGRPCRGCPMDKACALQPALTAADTAAMAAMADISLSDLIRPDRRASAA